MEQILAKNIPVQKYSLITSKKTQRFFKVRYIYISRHLRVYYVIDLVTSYVVRSKLLLTNNPVSVN